MSTQNIYLLSPGYLLAPRKGHTKGSKEIQVPDHILFMVMKHTTYNFDSFIKCTILFHQIHSQFCAAVNVVYFQAFSSPQEQNVNHEKSLPILCPLPPLPLAIHSSTSCIYGFSSVRFSSVQFSCSVVSDSLRPHGLQHLPSHFSLSCIGEGNGNPLQCSCPENPRDKGGWWAEIGRASCRERVSMLV